MKRRLFLVIIAFIMIVSATYGMYGCTSTKHIDKVLSAYETPEWYMDAKFGIFIHYGVYSVPAHGDEWYGHWMYLTDDGDGDCEIYDYHTAKYGGASVFGYKDFIPAFNEALLTYKANDTANTWAQLFSDTGAKYVVAVGMHHDSFALYDSDVQKTYNSVTQCGVDYIGDLQAACKNLNMKFGISNHFAENDWYFADGTHETTDLTDKAYQELYGTGYTTKQHVRKWYDISMEIIDKYQPDLIYYDFNLQDERFDTYNNANRYLMLSNYYEASANWENCDGVVCNYKFNAFTPATAVLDKERSVQPEIFEYYWQTDTSIGKNAWGYVDDEEYRSGEEFICALVDVVSKNGNLLLNVGPMADGTIPTQALECLNTIGEWLNKYGDAIYNTRAWTTYGEGDSVNEGDSYIYTDKDLRFTVSKDSKSLYCTAMAAPTLDKMTITTLKQSAFDTSIVSGIYLINGSERIALNYTQDSNGLHVSIPSNINTAYSIEIKLL